MCTAVWDTGPCPLFGRTLDLECSYGEEIVLTPRKFRFDFLHLPPKREHLALLGVAHVRQEIPLYYDAVNEAGLAMAGLSFSASAVYRSPQEGRQGLASFEVIPWILGQCESVSDAVALLKNVTVTDEGFEEGLNATPLHWLLADKASAIAVEPLEEGLRLWENPFGVLTNDPDFSYHRLHVASLLGLSPKSPRNLICPALSLSPVSKGTGSVGLPGDFSSPSRFVRALFARTHTKHGSTEREEVERFFHVMDTVAQPLGCAVTESGEPIATRYTDCVDLERKIYYFTTYHNRSIRAISMRDSDITNNSLRRFSMEE